MNPVHQPAQPLRRGGPGHRPGTPAPPPGRVTVKTVIGTTRLLDPPSGRPAAADLLSITVGRESEAHPAVQQWD